MALRLVYFAWVRERLGRDGEDVTPPPGVTTAKALAAWLAARGGAHAEVFGDMARLRVAVDLAMADAETTIAGAREVAFFPPVTGG